MILAVNRYYKTRDGNVAKILSIFVPFYIIYKVGKTIKRRKINKDLELISEFVGDVGGWINIYTSTISKAHPTKEAADAQADNHRVECIYVENLSK